MAMPNPSLMALLDNLLCPITTNPVTPNKIAKIETYRGRIFCGRARGIYTAEDAVVEIVRTLVTDEPFGMTEVGVKEHWASAGSPEQEKFTAWLNPPIGVIVKVNVALAPAVMVALDGEVEMLKSITF